ncbi:MAG: uroporphyrinogen decarboxylase [Bacteroidetes bacterium HGW-Bacteroidetes-16]|jgi:uroporphyrinogen decarboxylase|nr:MAG: uroporphyrinogen decarboxylase [Bacteroidetes bacterium HGW-Bacteroidetes-16]
MNSLERILAAVSGDDTDYQPFTLLLSLYGASLNKSDTKAHYRDAALWYKGQRAVIDTFDPDIVITPFSLPTEAEAFGSELVFLDHYGPNVKKPIITELSQIDQLIVPDLETSPSLQFFLKCTNFLSDDFRGNKAIASPIHSPADIPALIMGIEMWIDTLLFHPKEVEKIMEKTVKHFIQFGNELIERGATFLVVPVNFTTPMIITEKIFNHLLPYLANAFRQIKGPIVIHNGGSKLMPFIHYFAKLPNVIAFVLEPTESFDEARRIIGNKLILMGNIDGPGLLNYTKDKAQEITLKILNNRKADKHFIFATSNADIPYDTPVETIQNVVDTIRNFKKY